MATRHDQPPPTTQNTGIRLGPMTWVPQLRTRANDPWAHRKGEPRPLALLWAVYLMASALLTLLRVRSLTMPTTEQFAFGCRGMLLLVLIGVTILWPMVRLSQAPPARPLRAALADLAVILVPVQAVIWPMPLLTHWSASITAALAACLAAWAALAGGVIALADAQPSSMARWTWIAALVFVSLAPPAINAISILSEPASTALRWASPLTVAWAITDAPNSLAPVMQPREWAWALAPLAPGALLGLLARRLASGTASG